jgi:ribose 5-phosphate isomerase A
MNNAASNVEALKREAAEKAGEWITDGIVLGLGTGSTVRYLLEHIAARRAAGEWGRITCVPTSEDTAARAEALGIPLATLEERPEIDLTIDGADEIAPDLSLVKGLGGALFREKVVASVSRQLVIVADHNKLVPVLGYRAPLPVEVDPFAAPVQPRFLRGLGADPVIRRQADGSCFVTDGGNYIFDCYFTEAIGEPESLEAALDARPGIVEHGLFLGMAATAVVAGEDGTLVLERPRSHASLP